LASSDPLALLAAYWIGGRSILAQRFARRLGASGSLDRERAALRPASNSEGILTTPRQTYRAHHLSGVIVWPAMSERRSSQKSGGSLCHLAGAGA
jgi:hypothetical protein